MSGYKKLLADIVDNCILHGITIILSNEKDVKLIEEDDDMRSSGFFEADGMILAVGTKKPFKKWFQILLHEYNHVIQFFNGETFESCELFFSWLENEIEIDNISLNNLINEVRDIELDCEKRTWKMIKDNPDLKIDPTDYVKNSNAYLFTYSIMRDIRKWYKKPPYDVKEIVDLMPGEFVDDYD
jgi:hypothetical protein